MKNYTIFFLTLVCTIMFGQRTTLEFTNFAYYDFPNKKWLNPYQGNSKFVFDINSKGDVEYYKPNGDKLILQKMSAWESGTTNDGITFKSISGLYSGFNIFSLSILATEPPSVKLLLTDNSNERLILFKKLNKNIIDNHYLTKEYTLVSTDKDWEYYVLLQDSFLTENTYKVICNIKQVNPRKKTKGKNGKISVTGGDYYIYHVSFYDGILSGTKSYAIQSRTHYSSKGNVLEQKYDEKYSDNAHYLSDEPIFESVLSYIYNHCEDCRKNLIMITQSPEDFKRHSGQ